MGNETFNHLVISDEPDTEVEEIRNTIPYEVIAKAKEIDPALYNKTEDQLEVAADIGFSDMKIKKSFWKNYKIAAKAGSRFSMNKMLTGISTITVFRKRFLNNSDRLAWLLTPASSYSVQLESLLDMSMKRYEELINMDISTTKKVKYKDDDGVEQEKLVTQTDAKKAMVLLSVIKNLEERVLGGSVQRNVSVKTSEPTTADKEKASVDMVAVNEKLKELENKLGNKPVTIEVLSE